MELETLFNKVVVNYRNINNNLVKDISLVVKDTKKIIKKFLLLYNKEKKTNYSSSDFSIKSFIDKFKNEY